MRGEDGHLRLHGLGLPSVADGRRDEAHPHEQPDSQADRGGVAPAQGDPGDLFTEEGLEVLRRSSNAI